MAQEPEDSEAAGTHDQLTMTDPKQLFASLVELIGGPLCGERKHWTSEDAIAIFSYYAGTASYTYEGEGKATYVCG